MKKILSILAVAAVAFTACTTDITEDVVKNEGVAYSVPLEFAVEQEVSRAFLGDDLSISFEEGDEVGVYVTPADATAAVTKNAKGTIAKKDGVLTVSVDVASFAAGDKVMAYYPYDAANNNNEATDIILTMPHVQVQSELDKVSTCLWFLRLQSSRVQAMVRSISAPLHQLLSSMSTRILPICRAQLSQMHVSTPRSTRM